MTQQSNFQIGDRVEILPMPLNCYGTPHLCGRQTRVTGFMEGAIECDISILEAGPPPTFSSWMPGPHGLLCFESRVLKKIDDDGEQASWGEIEKITHWNPTKVTA